MTSASPFHIVTVGWPQVLIDGLCADIAARSTSRFSHIPHPRYAASDWTGTTPAGAMRFFRDSPSEKLPSMDAQLLASLEQEGVPTIHNMILGDRVVCRLDYGEALRYATFISKKLLVFFAEMQPTVVIGAFDSLHGGLAHAVARRMGVPWFAMHFSVIPTGLACFCDRLSPASRVKLAPRPGSDPRALAESALHQFEARNIKAYAYAPPPPTLRRLLSRLPARFATLVRTMCRHGGREFAKFTEVETRYSVAAALRQIRRSHRARKALLATDAVTAPPPRPYLLFGLHMQPESSIDVWAPFFSNQMWVIELVSRSMPPSHSLLVKLHKSDVSNYSGELLERMRSFPGVALVHPAADARVLIERADLVVGIQGTMGLEAALLGKPVIMFGDSPVTQFPSASSIGEIQDLPALIRRKLREAPPSREGIVRAYASYLAPFSPASHNDWTRRIGEGEIEGYVQLFDRLRQHLALNQAHADKAG